VSKFLLDLYSDIDDELPFGKERLVLSQLNELNIKELFEKMSLSPERKIIFHNGENIHGILTLSDLFNIINLHIN
jgi:hypothetical protein